MSQSIQASRDERSSLGGHGLCGPDGLPQKKRKRREVSLCRAQAVVGGAGGRQFEVVCAPRGRRTMDGTRGVREAGA